MSTLVTCKELTKSYGKNTALNRVSFEIESGHIIGLLGPNGSGKTTLIKLLNGLLTPTSGELYVKKLPVGKEYKKIISYLPDQTYLNMNSTVQEVLDYFGAFYADFDKNRALEMLNSLQISPKDRLKSMSKGTKEKVQLILVMSRDADLYVLDEPIAGVDPASRDYILRTIVSNYNRNASVLLSTHLISDVESILDEVVFIKYGNIILQAPAEQIRQREGKSIDRFFREVFAC